MITHLNCIGGNLYVCECVCMCVLANFIIIGTSPGTRLAAFYGQRGKLALLAIKSSDKFVDWQPWRK